MFDWSRLKAFEDDEINVIENFKFVWEMVENILGNGENAGYQHFLLFLQCFQKASYTGSFKVGIVWQRVNIFILHRLRNNFLQFTQDPAWLDAEMFDL